MKGFSARNATLLIVTAILISSCVVQRSPVTGTKRAYGYSWEQELQIGKEADQQIQQQYGIYDNQELADYVKDVGRDVLSVSHMRRESTLRQYRNTEFHFRVLNNSVVNAFALPGGYVYLTRGLLAYLENEAQLAMVLGHEIGHVAARHASQRAFEQQVGQIALLGSAVVGQELLGVPGGRILDVGSQAARYLFLSYSRDDEREADRLGVEYAAIKNYKAEDGAGFFSALERISRQSGQSIPDWQSTHPDPEERAKTIPELAQRWREKGYDQSLANTEEYMQNIDGIIFGENPREGYTENSFFYHPDLRFQFQYPSGWEVINQPSSVAMVNEEQDAVSIMQIDNESASVRASVTAFVNQEGFRVRYQNDTNNNGLDGYEAIASADAVDGTGYRFYVYAVSHGDNIYRFISYSLSTKFADYQLYFKKTSNSFAPLTNQRILNIKPVRLQTMKANRTAPFSTYLPESLPMSIEPEDVAIVNQVSLEETVKTGSWIKIPGQ